MQEILGWIRNKLNKFQFSGRTVCNCILKVCQNLRRCNENPLNPLSTNPINSHLLLLATEVLLTDVRYWQTPVLCRGFTISNLRIPLLTTICWYVAWRCQFLYIGQLKMPSNFLPKIFSLTGHVKTEKLICKSIVYVQCSRLEARILLAIICSCLPVYSGLS